MGTLRQDAYLIGFWIYNWIALNKAIWIVNYLMYMLQGFKNNAFTYTLRRACLKKKSVFLLN